MERRIDNTEKFIRSDPLHPDEHNTSDKLTLNSAVVGNHRPVTRFDSWIVNRLLHAIGNPPILVSLWDGKVAYQPDETAVADMTIWDRRTLFRLLRSPDYQFGEAYSDGKIEIKGDLVQFCEAVYRTLPDTGMLGRAWLWLRTIGKTTLSASKRNIHHHYDLGNDFYQRWLDEKMLYTCAYFQSPDMSLEAAQTAKMDYICRKVLLKPGQSVVEAGCGWGALALHMAKHYGVRVRAYNISHEQIVYARDCAKREGLNNQVEFVEDDWRTISGQFDKFVSVGMVEHVGLRNYKLLGDIIHKSLRKQGLGFIHTIGRNVAAPMDPWIEQRIFPGAYPPSLKQMMNIFEKWHYSILDIENLRLHYAQTLRHWLQRYLSHIEIFREKYDESFIRSWELYLAGSVATFTTGSLELFQVIFTHPENNMIPWTRKYLYTPEEQTITKNGPDDGIPV